MTTAPDRRPPLRVAPIRLRGTFHAEAEPAGKSGSCERLGAFGTVDAAVFGGLPLRQGRTVAAPPATAWRRASSALPTRRHPGAAGRFSQRIATRDAATSFRAGLRFSEGA